jgi:hypothetical protein
MKTLRCVGLDVHKESIAIAVAEPEGGEPSLVGTIPNDTRLLLQKLLRGRTDRVRSAPGFGRGRLSVRGGGAVACVQAGRVAGKDRPARRGEAGAFSAVT